MGSLVGLFMLGWLPLAQQQDDPITLWKFAMKAWLTEGISSLGPMVALGVGGFFAFLIVSMALGWGRTAVSGGAEDEGEDDEL